MQFLFYYKIIYLWKQKGKWLFLYGIPFLIIVFTHLSFRGQSLGETAIPIGVVMREDSEENKEFVKIIQGFRGEGDRPLFRITQCSKENAKELLKEDSLKGYIILGEAPELISKTRGSDIMVVKTLLDTYFNIETRGVLASRNLFYNQGEVKGRNVTKENIYDMALALACLLGGMLAMKEVFQMEPYFSSTAVIYSVVPVSKEKLFFYNLLGAFSIHFVMVMVLGGFVYQICLASKNVKWVSVILVLFVGSLLGFLLGAFFGMVWKVNEGIKKVVFVGICFVQIFLSLMVRIPQNPLPNGLSVLENKLPSSWLIQSIYQMNQGGEVIRIQKSLFFMAVTSLFFFVFIFWKIGRRQYDGF